MTPVPEPQTRPAFLDRHDRIEISHPLAAGALMMLGHELLGAVNGRVFFRKSALADYNVLNRCADEARAHLERARSQSPTPYFRRKRTQNTHYADQR